MNDKVKSYLGFCIKKGSMVVGYNDLETVRKRIYLVICDKTLGENTFKKVVKLVEKFGCPLLVSQEEVANYVYRDCKILGIKDKNLANAVIQNAGEGFSPYQGGC